MTIQHRKPSYTSIGGFRLPRDFSPKVFESGLGYKAQPEDVFIATYPKCGTTWVQYIVWLIQHDGEPMPVEKRMTVEIPHLEEVGSKRSEGYAAKGVESSNELETDWFVGIKEGVGFPCRFALIVSTRNSNTFRF